MIVASLGIFRFKEKNEKKAQIEQIVKQIDQLSSVGALQAETARLKGIKDQALKKYSTEIARYLDQRFPNRARANCSEAEKYSDNSPDGDLSIPSIPDADIFG